MFVTCEVPAKDDAPSVNERGTVFVNAMTDSWRWLVPLDTDHRERRPSAKHGDSADVAMEEGAQAEELDLETQRVMAEKLKIQEQHKVKALAKIGVQRREAAENSEMPASSTEQPAAADVRAGPEDARTEEEMNSAAAGQRVLEGQMRRMDRGRESRAARQAAQNEGTATAATGVQQVSGSEIGGSDGYVTEEGDSRSEGGVTYPLVQQDDASSWNSELADVLDVDRPPRKFPYRLSRSKTPSVSSDPANYPQECGMETPVSELIEESALVRRNPPMWNWRK